MSGLLSDDVLSHIGKQSEPRREIVTRRDIRKYAIATDNRQAKYLDGNVAPPLFHLHLFWDVVPLSELVGFYREGHDADEGSSKRQKPGAE